MRLQLSIDDEEKLAMEKIMEECRIRTKQELLNNTVTLFKYCIKEIKSGRIICSLDEQNEKYREILMPAFQNVKPKKP